LKRSDRPWVWVDFENTPHVLFLEPFIRRLRQEGWEVGVTAKPQAQTLELAAARRLEVEPIGRGDFAGLVGKLIGGGQRSLALMAWLSARGRPRALLSSSRSASLAAFLARVPAIGLLDYEHAALGPFALSTRVWLPDVLCDVALPSAVKRVAGFYPGLKENLYLDECRFDRSAERRGLGARDGEYLVIARPAAATAHYATELSDRLWFAALEAVSGWSNVRVIVSPRTNLQRAELQRRLPTHGPVSVLEQVIPGPGLVAAADLLIGGGGTMNREAAVLGVPVWSVFCGKTPSIDVQLAAEGRLRWVRSEQELGDALGAERPQRGNRRGPFPDGFACIYSDLASRLNGLPSSPTPESPAAAESPR
jgi:uncharacterized protein